MLTQLSIEPYTLSGVSVGGVYTSLFVPELDSIFDVGIAPRSNVGASYLFVSHAHADHVGALPTLFGIRGLSHQPVPQIYAPAECAQSLTDGVVAFNRGQRRQLAFTVTGLAPGEERQLRGDLHFRTFRTLHSIPSLGYVLFRRVPKLRPEFLQLPGKEIAVRRRAGEDLFYQEERLEFAYATDTLIDVLDRNPELYSSRTLVLECTFLDERKSKEETRRKCHVHWEEILERADLFQNEHLVLMHFSQTYRPSEVHEILKERAPAHLWKRLRIFAPKRGQWPG